MANHKSIAFGALVVGLGLIGAAGAYQAWKDDHQQTVTSDASGIKETIRVGVDGWVGYFPLCSPEMLKRMYIRYAESHDFKWSLMEETQGDEAAPLSATGLVGNMEVLVPMAGLIDADAEIARLNKVSLLCLGV